MTTYIVEAKETIHYMIVIEADSEQEAIDAVHTSCEEDDWKLGLNIVDYSATDFQIKRCWENK